MLVKISLFLSLMLASLGVFADGYLVAITDFSCPACKVLNKNFAEYKTIAERNDMTFSLAPVPFNGKEEGAYRERLYFAARELLPEGYDVTVRNAFFEEKDSEVGENEALAILRMYSPDVDWNALAKDAVDTPLVIRALKKSIALALAAELTEFPTFAIIKNGKITKVPVTGNIKDKTKALSEWVDANAKDL